MSNTDPYIETFERLFDRFRSLGAPDRRDTDTPGKIEALYSRQRDLSSLGMVGWRALVSGPGSVAANPDDNSIVPTQEAPVRHSIGVTIDLQTGFTVHAVERHGEPKRVAGSQVLLPSRVRGRPRQLFTHGQPDHLDVRDLIRGQAHERQVGAGLNVLVFGGFVALGQAISGDVGPAVRFMDTLRAEVENL